jgi:hypothetical protein
MQEGNLNHRSAVLPPICPERHFNVILILISIVYNIP